MFEEIRRQQELQKANILRGFGINPESEDLELEIFKAQETDIEKAKHQDGDMHPNGKWVWVSSANGGKGDWRTKGGRTHTKHSAGGNAGTGSTTTNQQKPTTQVVGTTKKITSDKEFFDTFRDASDDVLNKIVSGKIQASDREKKLIQQIIDERKKPKVGDVSKLTAQQKSMVDKVMDKGFLMTSNKYNDKSKVELKKTTKGNWRCYYDGRDIGATISGKLISDTAAKKIGWYKEETKSTTASTKTKPAAKTQATVSQTTNSSESKKNKLTPKQQKIVDGFMDKVKTSDSRYSDPSKVTLWKTPKGNWYVKYDGHQVATIAPSGLTEKIAEAAGMKIDREPSSYQSSKTKKSTTPKTDKERLDLQQEYATMSQLIKKPSTSAQHKKEFQDRMKEIEGMGLKVVKGKFQWSDTGSAVTPKATKTTPSAAGRVLMSNLKTDHLKNAPEGHIIIVDKPGSSQGVYAKYVKLADGYWKNATTNQRYTNAQMKQRLEGLHKNLYGIDLNNLTESKTTSSSSTPKQQKKLRPVGTGTNGPERRRKETKSSKPKYSEMSADDLEKELVGKTLVEEENIKGKKTTRTYEITNVVKFRGRVEIEYASSDEPYVHVLNPKILEDGHDGDMYKYTLK